jgi:hypothetical protein
MWRIPFMNNFQKAPESRLKQPSEFMRRFNLICTVAYLLIGLGSASILYAAELRLLPEALRSNKVPGLTHELRLPEAFSQSVRDGFKSLPLTPKEDEDLLKTFNQKVPELFKPDRQEQYPNNLKEFSNEQNVTPELREKISKMLIYRSSVYIPRPWMASYQNSSVPIIDCRRDEEGLFTVTYADPAARRERVCYTLPGRSNLVDVVGQIFRLHPPGSTRIEFYARGFEEEDARKLLLNLEIEAERHSMLRINAAKELDTGNLIEKIQKKKYDFAGATIREVPDEIQVKEMDGGSEITLKIDVNAVEVPLSLRIRFWLEGVMGKERVTSIRAMLSQFLESLSDPISLTGFAVEFRKATNKYWSDHGLHGRMTIQFHEEEHDVQIGQRTPDCHHETTAESHTG